MESNLHNAKTQGLGLSAKPDLTLEQGQWQIRHHRHHIYAFFQRQSARLPSFTLCEAHAVTPSDFRDNPLCKSGCGFQ